MLELPDITVYIEALEKRTVGQRLMQVRVTHPFLVRSVDPPMSKIRGKMVNGYRRIGKRIVMALEDELFLVLHPMIAGRLRWKTSSDARPPGRRGLAAFGFESGTLSSPRRAANGGRRCTQCEANKNLSSMIREGWRFSTSTWRHSGRSFCARTIPSNAR